MNFLKTLFWIVLTVVAVVFSVDNWTPGVQVQLWGGYAADTHIPVLVIGAFLLGLLPMMIVHRAKLWSLRRQLALAESADEEAEDDAEEEDEEEDEEEYEEEDDEEEEEEDADDAPARRR